MMSPEVKKWFRESGVSKNDKTCISCEEIIIGNNDYCDECDRELHPIRLNMHNIEYIMTLPIQRQIKAPQ